MPILHNNRPLFRIKFKDANIREVRRGNELEWGLYFIEYKKGIDVGYEENISEYVWGYPGYIKEDFILNLPEGFDEGGGFTADEMRTVLGASFAYKTKANGWYSEPGCLTYIPAITREFHKDLLLYCKWTQRRFSWNGKYMWTRRTWVEGGGSGEFEPRTSRPTPDDSAYQWDLSTPVGLPNCTWYCYYRAQEAGASAPTSGGFGNAGRWWLDHPGDGWTALWYDSNWESGDILVYGDASDTSYSTGYHVAFVESNGTISESVYTKYVSVTGDTSTKYPIPRTSCRASYEWIDNNGYWNKTAWNASGSALSSTVATRYFRCDGTTGTKWSGVGDYLGRLHYTSWPSEGHWEYEYNKSWDYTQQWYNDYHIANLKSINGEHTYYAGDDGTQDMPMAPDPSGSPNRIDQRWEYIYCFTEERYLTYNDDGTLKWSDWVDVTPSDNRNYVATGTYGPLNGWLMSW